MSRILLSLMLIGTLLFGQTFCCCTAKASALLKSHAVLDSPPCCCGSEKGPCPHSDHPEGCPCKQKRQLADVGVPVSLDTFSQLHHGFVDFMVHIPSEPTVEIVPLLASRWAQEDVLRALPRADRVALSQSLMC